MPWLTLAVMLISYFLQDRSTPEARKKAALGALLAGGATYAVTHFTEWGSENLGAYDGVATTTSSGAAAAATAGGAAATGGPKINPTTPTGGSSVWDVLKDWGAAGVAGVIGVTGIAANSELAKYVPWIIGGLVLFLVIK